MVGVPGRSSGCHTCRARHIKCDERKPTCLRCEKSGYTCQGYKKPIHFLIHTAAGPSSSSSSSESSASASPAPPAARARALAKARAQIQQKPQDAPDQRAVVRRKQQFAYYFPSVPQELGLDSFMEDMAFSFTFSNLVYSSFGRPWLQLAAKGRIDDMSLSACRALALGFFGNSQRQKKIQDKGSSEYGASLRLLIKELSKVDQKNAGKYIVPVMVLLMYNFSVTKNADFSHHDGLKQLLLLCGPEKFQHQPWLSAFEATRDLLISKSLLERKRTFFEESKWKIIPWALDPAAKSPSNALLDVLCDVPGFLEDEMTFKATNDIPLRLGLLTRVEKSLQELYHWRWAWEARNPNAVVEVPAKAPADYKRSEIPPGLETALHYKNWLQANEICLYNAVLLWVLRFLGELRPAAFPYPSPSPSSQHSSPSPPAASSPQSNQSSDDYSYLQDHIFANMPRTPLLLPGQARSLRQPAMEICRSFEYILDTFTKSDDTALSWLMPISLAYYVVQDDEEYARWIRKKLDGFEDIWAVLQNSNPDSVYWCERTFHPSPSYGPSLNISQGSTGALIDTRLSLRNLAPSFYKNFESLECAYRCADDRLYQAKILKALPDIVDTVQENKRACEVPWINDRYTHITACPFSDAYTSRLPYIRALGMESTRQSFTVLRFMTVCFSIAIFQITDIFPSTKGTRNFSPHENLWALYTEKHTVECVAAAKVPKR